VVRGRRPGALVQHSELQVSAQGPRYVMSKEQYEDLDEVVARGIEPLVQLIDAVVRCPKYLACAAASASDKECQQQVEAALAEQLRVQPSRIAYLFWLSRDVPGVIVWSVGPRHHEPIHVQGGQYVFRRRHRFATLGALVDHLKSQGR